MRATSPAEAKARGLKRFFTGKPCKRGHVAERLTSAGNCVDCRREPEAKAKKQESDAKYRAMPEVKAKKQESDAKYHATPEYKAKKRERDAKPEAKVKKQECNAKYYATPEAKVKRQEPVKKAKKQAYDTKYHAKPEEKAKKKERDATPAYKAKTHARNGRRRARKLGQSPPLTPAEKLRIVALYAEAARRTIETGEQWHVDHDKPLALGGLEHPDNLMPLPASMNIAKGARHASTWDFISS